MEGKTIKGYYFSQVETTGLGPRKKILAQIKTFQKAGIDFELVESPFMLEGAVRGNFILRQLVSRLPFTYVYSKHEYKSEYEKADIIYIRFLAGDRLFIRFLKQLRRNTNAKIVMELPDYPTTWYMTTSKFMSFVYAPIIIKDWIAGKKYKKYIDRIVMLKDKKEVFGIPVVKFTNGIDMDIISERKPLQASKISMIAVAGMCNFHGYDRMLEGLKEYYGSGGDREIEFHLVGGKDAPGNELKEYKRLCKEYQLEKYVIFHGEKQGKELDDIYDSCNMAVASLGMYRIGYQTANSLKIREYMAKGLPIITGCKIDIMDPDYRYNLEFSNDEQPIEISSVVTFFEKVYSNSKDYARINDEIRQYAQEHCDMTITLKPIIDYMKQ